MANKSITMTEEMKQKAAALENGDIIELEIVHYSIPSCDIAADSPTQTVKINVWKKHGKLYGYLDDDSVKTWFDFGTGELKHAKSVTYASPYHRTYVRMLEAIEKWLSPEQIEQDGDETDIEQFISKLESSDDGLLSIDGTRWYKAWEQTELIEKIDSDGAIDHIVQTEYVLSAGYEGMPADYEKRFDTAEELAEAALDFASLWRDHLDDDDDESEEESLKTTTLHIRLANREHAAIKTAAEAVGKTMTAFILDKLVPAHLRVERKQGAAGHTAKREFEAIDTVAECLKRIGGGGGFAVYALPGPDGTISEETEAFIGSTAFRGGGRNGYKKVATGQDVLDVWDRFNELGSEAYIAEEDVESAKDEADRFVVDYFVKAFNDRVGAEEFEEFYETTFYIEPALLGGDATTENAERMIEILESKGFDVEFGATPWGTVYEDSLQEQFDAAFEEALDTVNSEIFAKKFDESAETED